MRNIYQPKREVIREAWKEAVKRRKVGYQMHPDWFDKPLLKKDFAWVQSWLKYADGQFRNTPVSERYELLVDILGYRFED